MKKCIGTDFDPRQLRGAFGAFATGVTVVTTKANCGRLVGLTANSFSSLSLEPPLVLWSLVKRSPNLEIFERAEYFGISVLADCQESLALQYARPSENKFEGVDVINTSCGVPLIAGAHAHFLCKAVFSYEGGDHKIFVGQVETFDASDKSPLIFYRGAFRRVLEQEIC